MKLTTFTIKHITRNDTCTIVGKDLADALNNAELNPDHWKEVEATPRLSLDTHGDN